MYKLMYKWMYKDFPLPTWKGDGRTGSISMEKSVVPELRLYANDPVALAAPQTPTDPVRETSSRTKGLKVMSAESAMGPKVRQGRAGTEIGPPVVAPSRCREVAGEPAELPESVAAILTLVGAEVPAHQNGHCLEITPYYLGGWNRRNLMRIQL